MSGPTACETLPSTVGAFPDLLPASQPAEEPAVSFEEALKEETAEEPVEESEEDEIHAPESALSMLFPLFSPPLMLVVQNAPTSPGGETTDTEGASESSEHILPSPGSPARPAPADSEQIAAKTLNGPEKGGGMTAAKPESMVFTHSNDEEGAATAKEKLPLGVDYVESPGFEKQVTVETSVSRQTNSKTATSETTPQTLGTMVDTKHEVGPGNHEVFQVEKPQSAMATRTVDEIGGHIQLLRTTGQDRLDVIVRPDGAMELHLQITKSDGQIQVRARCERGDFTGLDAQWSTVQSSLAAQGIRVEPLQAGLSADAHSQHRQGSARRDQEQNSPQFFIEQDTPSPSKLSGRPSQWSNRGWQRWA